LVPAHCCIQMQTVRARWPSDWNARLVSADTSRAALFATVGRFGLSPSLGPVRKSLQAPVPNPRPSARATAVKRVRISWSSGSAGEGEGKDERASVGAVEPADIAGPGLGASQIGLRVDARVIGPYEQVPTGHSQVHAAEAETPAHEPAGERVANGHLAELRKA